MVLLILYLDISLLLAYNHVIGGLAISRYSDIYIAIVVLYTTKILIYNIILKCLINLNPKCYVNK